MSIDLETSQGVVLRSIIVELARSVAVIPYNKYGRLDAFVFDQKVGILIKYSTKRLSPWPFTFHIDQVTELLDLEAEYPRSFVVFVCGPDGLLTIDLGTLHDLVSFKETEQAWLRIERRPRTLYSVSGNRSELHGKVPRGVGTIVSAIRE